MLWLNSPDKCNICYFFSKIKSPSHNESAHSSFSHQYFKTGLTVFGPKKYIQSLPNNFGLWRTHQTLYFPITPKTAGKKAVWKRGTLIKLLFYIQIFHRKPISLENNINLSWWWVQVRCPLWSLKEHPSICRFIAVTSGILLLLLDSGLTLGLCDIRVRDMMMSYFSIKCIQILSEGYWEKETLGSDAEMGKCNKQFLRLKLKLKTLNQIPSLLSFNGNGNLKCPSRVFVAFIPQIVDSNWIYCLVSRVLPAAPVYLVRARIFLNVSKTETEQWLSWENS